MHPVGGLRVEGLPEMRLPVEVAPGGAQSPVAFVRALEAPGDIPRMGGDSGGDDAGPQIWLIRAKGGEAWKLTTHKAGVQAFEWLPDGTGIAFAASQPKTDEQKAAEKAGEDAIAVDEGPNGQASGSYSHL